MTQPVIRMTITGVTEVRRKFGLFRKRVTFDSSELVHEFAHRLEVEVKSRADGVFRSSDPHPWIRSGEYYDSIQYFSYGPYEAGAQTIGIPYSNRLEYGFYGQDSLGRTFAQPAYPHWTPAKDVIDAEFTAAYAAATKRWWQ